MKLQANTKLEPHLVQDLVETYYGYQVQDIQKVRAVYRLETDQGIVAFKNARKMKDIRFINNVIEHLCINGFSHVPKLRKTLSNKLLLRYRGEVYVVEEWLPLEIKEVGVSKEDWLLPAGKALASYHQAIAAFPIEEIPRKRVPSPWGDWITHQYKKIKQTLPWETQERQWLCRQIERAQYHWNQQPSVSTHLCHGSLHQENIMINPDRQIWFIDYERLTYDAKGKDLAQLLMYHFRFHPWNSNAVEQLFHGYESVQPLEKADIHHFCSRSILLEKVIYAYCDGVKKIWSREQEDAKEQVLRNLFPSYWRD